MSKEKKRIIPRGIPDHVVEHFRHWIREYRTSNELTQGDMCQILRDAGVQRVSESLVSHWEQGIRFPSEGALQQIGKATGASMSQMIGETIRPHTLAIPIIGEFDAKTQALKMKTKKSAEDIIVSWQIAYDMLKNKTSELFAVRIKGDAMSPRYDDGDMLFFEKIDNAPRRKALCVIAQKYGKSIQIVNVHDNSIFLCDLGPRAVPVPAPDLTGYVGVLRGLYGQRTL